MVRNPGGGEPLSSIRTLTWAAAWLALASAGCSESSVTTKQAGVALVNGSFEAWTDSVPAGWSIVEGASEGPGAPSRVVRIDGGRDGELALGLSGNHETRVWRAVRQGPWAVEPGEIYRLDGWFRVAVPAPDSARYRNCQVYVLTTDEEGQKTGLYTTDFGSFDHPWRRFERYVVVPAGSDSLSVGVFLSMPGTVGVDGLELERVETGGPSLGRSREERWRQDVEVLSDLLPAIHPAPYRYVERETYQERLGSVLENLDTLTDAQVNLELMRAVALLQDAHTKLSFGAGPPARLPLGLECIDGKIVAVVLPEEDRDLLGSPVVAIDGHDVAEAIAVCDELVSCPSPGRKLSRIAQFLVEPGLLHPLGLSDSDSELGIAFAPRGNSDGRLRLSSNRLKYPRGYASIWNVAETAPLYLAERGNYWFRFLEASRTLYLRYKRCREEPGHPFARFESEIEEVLRDREPVSLVLDLRLNSGGASMLLRPLIDTFADYLTAGPDRRAFVLVDHGTFSSAIINAVQFRESTGAIVVGEPTGDRPNHCGETQTIELPNSRLRLTCSTKCVQLLDGDPVALEPDQVVHTTVDDVRQGRDPVMEAVLEILARR